MTFTCGMNVGLKKNWDLSIISKTEIMQLLESETFEESSVFVLGPFFIP